MFTGIVEAVGRVVDWRQGHLAVRRAELAPDLTIGGSIAVNGVCLTVVEVEAWREKFLLGAENALRNRPRDEESLKDAQIKKLKQKIGDRMLDNNILRVALNPYPVDGKTSDA